MKTHAVFVDAGYFLAEGSKLVFGQREKQDELFLNVDCFKTLFHSIDIDRAELSIPSDLDEKNQAIINYTVMDFIRSSDLLRIYWYDSIPRSGELNKPQTEIAESNNFKFRFGYIKDNKQKRVDSLIVTDIVELSRNKSISDIILIAGDEDHIIGLELAQAYGVRVHLVAIVSEKSKTYDKYLRREADSFHLLDKEIMRYLLELRKS